MHLLSDDFAENRASEDTYSHAYFAYNFPMNYMKTKYVVSELHNLYPGLLNMANMKVLDIGCGEGAGLLGVHDALPTAHIEILHGLDASRSMVKKARYMTRRLQHTTTHPRTRILYKDISEGLLRTRTKYDVILLCNSIIEIVRDDAHVHRFLLRISKNLTKDGIIIIIEPALITASRKIMAVRDHITTAQTFSILHPCLHTHTCPLKNVRGGKEWCHQTVRWKPPEYMQVLNQGLNRDLKTLKFSLLILSSSAPPSPPGYLVISSLFKEKGRQRCFLCTPDGRVELVRLNKHRSRENSDYEHIKKGAIVALQGIEKKRPGFWVVNKNSLVQLLYGEGLL
jgi:ribosomal protein RSM22 (predicted rRNA methylase)